MNDAANPRPLRIGLTGGIASGKTTVADYFAELGVPVIDTDVIARDVVAEGAPALAEIRAAFGNGVFDDRGLLDRRKMRKRVFADDALRRTLESILHPRIQAETIARVEAVSSPYLIIVVPLLVDSTLRAFMDRVLLVDCTEETQLRRLLARDDEDEQQARRMLAAQASREARQAIADDVVMNDGDLEAAHTQVRKLHRRYLELAAAMRA